MMASQQVIPEKLRWIPGIIAKLDDAQDLLYTALVLARPLLVKLPARFVPYLGWVLLANDIINLSTGLLGTAMGGRSFKRASLDAMATIAKRRLYTSSKGFEFLREKIQWLPFLLQGGQAMETLTGYGLSLGSAMGLVTGATWGAVRFAQGDQININSIPRDDILAKSTRVLLNSWSTTATTTLFTEQETDLLIGAQAIASAVIRQQSSPDFILRKANEYMGTLLPAPDNRFDADFALWLEEEGYSIAGKTIGGAHFHEKLDGAITWSDTVEKQLRNAYIWENGQSELYGKTTHGTGMGMIHSQAQMANVEWIAPPDETPVPIYAKVEQDVAAAIEYGVIPDAPLTPELVERWTTQARILSISRGLTRAGFEELKQAALEVAGGYRRIVPQTFVYPR